MNLTDARRITGGLSKPSKMPGHSYSMPAQVCQVGGRLRKIQGSTCESCYALKGNYTRYPNVFKSQTRRLESLTHPYWIDAMVKLIDATGDKYFRWHDAGDLQSVDHLANICEVVRRTPAVRHWMPTREYKMVADYQKTGQTIPANFVIRLSAHMVDGAPPTAYGLPTSTVSSNGAATCPSATQGNVCGDCRDCWNPTVANVAYGKH